MYKGIVVCNSGPLIGLSLVNHLDLLPQLFEHVVIPPGVFEEVTVAGGGRVGSAQVREAHWLQRRELEHRPERMLTLELGRGEAEVISLADQMGATLVLIDERKARRIAEQGYGLRVKGTAGILVAAKKNGLLASVVPLLETMAARGYFLSRRIIDRAAQEAGE